MTLASLSVSRDKSLIAYHIAKYVANEKTVSSIQCCRHSADVPELRANEPGMVVVGGDGHGLCLLPDLHIPMDAQHLDQKGLPQVRYAVIAQRR
jgi:hypothetical protein